MKSKVDSVERDEGKYYCEKINIKSWRTQEEKKRILISRSFEASSPDSKDLLLHGILLPTKHSGLPRSYILLRNKSASQITWLYFPLLIPGGDECVTNYGGYRPHQICMTCINRHILSRRHHPASHSKIGYTIFPPPVHIVFLHPWEKIFHVRKMEKHLHNHIPYSPSTCTAYWTTNQPLHPETRPSVCLLRRRRRTSYIVSGGGAGPGM